MGDQIEKGTQMPYATHTEIVDVQIARTTNTRYARNQFQLDIYAATDIVGTYANTVKDELDNSESALTSPFAMPAGIVGHVSSVRLIEGPITEQEGDRVYRSRMTFEVMYSQPQNRTPV